MKKNKIIVVFLGILIILLFTFLVSNKEKEGMGNDCKYQYLAPIKNSDGIKSWNENVINEFITVYNKTIQEVGIFPTDYKINKEVVDHYSKSIYTEDQAKYYIKNKKFPINSYMSNLIKNDAKIRAKFNEKVTPENVSKIYPVRQIYYEIIYNRENKSEQNSDAYKIYAGEMPEPTCESKETKPTETKETRPTETKETRPTETKLSNLSNDDFNKLKNICKAVK
jgi:hypothetical protein